jgi:hypothetical protein
MSAQQKCTQINPSRTGRSLQMFGASWGANNTENISGSFYREWPQRQAKPRRGVVS